MLAEQLPPLMPGFFKVEDSIGTIHYSRFTFLSEKTMLFLGDFDGEFSPTHVRSGQKRRAGLRRDLPAGGESAAQPGRRNADAFVEWTGEHLLHAVNIYTAYPDVTAKEIKALAAAAGVTGGVEQRPFLVVLPIKSKIAYVEVQLLLRARGHGTTKDLDKVGTPHFAQFVPLEDNQIGFFTVYDGTFDTYIADFTKNIGEVFDLIIQVHQGRAAFAMPKASAGVR